MSEERAVSVPDGLEGERVDSAIARLFGLSRTRAADLVTGGHVLLGGGPPSKSARVHAGQLLEVSLPDAPAASTQAPAQAVPGLQVVFDDEHIVVVDKPVGVAAHPSPGWNGPTVVGGLAGVGLSIATSGAAERQGVVHRLDVGTSGLMVVAKSERAYSELKRAFKERSVEKVYHAAVQGHPDPSRGTIDAPIGRHPRHDWKWAVTSGGKESVTHYQTLEAFPAASLLEVRLETGRTHQIRVHMNAIKHPCLGDLTYGADPALSARVGLQHQWLHAHRLAFAHPVSGDWLELTSRYPDDLQAALDLLRPTGTESTT